MSIYDRTMSFQTPTKKRNPNAYTTPNKRPSTNNLNVTPIDPYASQTYVYVPPSPSSARTVLNTIPYSQIVREQRAAYLKKCNEFNALSNENKSRAMMDSKYSDFRLRCDSLRRNEREIANSKKRSLNKYKSDMAQFASAKKVNTSSLKKYFNNFYKNNEPDSVKRQKVGGTRRTRKSWGSRKTRRSRK